MTAHKIDNMVTWFPESLSEAQILEKNEKDIPKRRNLVWVFSNVLKVLFLNNILHLISTREAEIVSL